jgi:hypothetical protein
MSNNQAGQYIIINALLSAFPTIASYNDFKNIDSDISGKSIPALIKYVYKKGIIENSTEQALVDFLAANDKPESSPPEDLTFDKVIDILSGKMSVNSFIQQLNKFADELLLPEVNAPMITRLRKEFILNTSKKRALVRMVAFKLAEKCPHLNINYETIIKLPGNIEEVSCLPKEVAGVSATFHLQGRGALIVPADVIWLKNELAECIDYLNLAGNINKKAIETNGATSFNIRAPKKQGQPDEPRLYDQAIRDILAIAQQMSVRWLLSPNSNPHKKLTIIIHAGLMSEANLTTQPLLEKILPAESGIYLTELAHLCARIAEIKAFFERHAERRSAERNSSGETSIWSVRYFWPHNYYDYIPVLLKEEMIPVQSSDASYDAFQKALFFSEQDAQNPIKALEAIKRYPQSTVLLIEIVKVLRARKMFYEADAVISNLLLIDHQNIVARLMRMIIYSNIAQIQPDFRTSALAFKRSITEGEIITGYSDVNSIVWSEFGLVYYSMAIKYIKRLRANDQSYKAVISQNDIVSYLQKAEDCLLKSMSLSATGKDASSLCWYGYVHALREYFASDEKLLSRSNSETLTDDTNLFRKNGISVFTEIGWLRTSNAKGEIDAKAFRNLLKSLLFTVSSFEYSSLTRSFIPYMKYMLSIILWDFMPFLTPGICNRVLDLLNNARIDAMKAAEHGIAIHRSPFDFVTLEEFLKQIDETINYIKKSVTAKDLDQPEDTPFPKELQKKLSRIKLILWEIDHY